jgi:formate hydrogenlyase subunit 3/multisubunit Na+/H+ antiporter MnhD subunit
MRNFTFWNRWLWIASLVLIVFGIAIGTAEQDVRLRYHQPID